MKEELEKSLIEKYPEFFQGHKLPPTQSLMCFGCECDDGWYQIIENLCGYIKSLIHRDHTLYVKDELFSKERTNNWDQNIVHVPAPEIVFTQIKEKYATLRIYYYIKAMQEDFPGREKLNLDLLEKHYWEIDQRIQSAIDFAEYISSKTCEVTGLPGSLHHKGFWYKTLCPSQAEQLGYEAIIEED